MNNNEPKNCENADDISRQVKRFVMLSDPATLAMSKAMYRQDGWEDVYPYEKMPDWLKSRYFILV